MTFSSRAEEVAFCTLAGRLCRVIEPIADLDAFLAELEHQEAAPATIDPATAATDPGDALAPESGARQRTSMTKRQSVAPACASTSQQPLVGKTMLLD